MTDLKTGDRLDNGATVIHATPRDSGRYVALCTWSDQWVIWTSVQHFQLALEPAAWHPAHGHYFDDGRLAMRRYLALAERYCGPAGGDRTSVPPRPSPEAYLHND